VGSTASLPVLPDVNLFVDELKARADNGFAIAMRSIGSAILHAGGTQDDCVFIENSPASRSAYKLACCAEEIAGIHGLVERHRERMFAHSAIEYLRPFLAPLEPSRAAMDFHRLHADFKIQPARTRTRAVEYIFEINGMRGLKHLIEADPVSQLAIEMTVSSDGVGGILTAMVMRSAPATPPTASNTPPARFG